MKVGIQAASGISVYCQHLICQGYLERLRQKNVWDLWMHFISLCLAINRMGVLNFQKPSMIFRILKCFFNSISTWKFICPIPDTTSYPERVLRDIIIWHGCQPNDDAALNEGIRVIRNISGLLYYKQVSRAGTSNYTNKLITHIFISRSPWLSVVLFISL